MYLSVLGKPGLSLGLGMVYVKRHEVEGNLLVAICDAELVDRVIVDEEKGIKFHVSPYFYKGELMSIDRAIDELSRADIANIVGRRIVSAAINNGFIHKDAVIKINNIPHAQFVVLRG